MNVPETLRYTKEHEWVRIDGPVATIGITDFAQGELGDIVFVELPQIGYQLTQMKNFGTIEAVKAVSDLFSPVTGKVIEINAKLETDPMVINRDPYGEGWMLKVEIANPSEIEQLLPADSYKGMLA